MIAALVAVFFWSGDAIGQTACAEYGKAKKSLERDYSEVPVSMGLSSAGTVIEVFTSPTNTFTILQTKPDGTSCVMTSGQYWETHIPAPSEGPEITYKGDGF